MQVRLPIVLVHVAFVEQPPLLVAHSFTSVLQVAPVQPAGQEQVKLPTPSVQVPPLRQGFGAQSLMLVQVMPSPEYPELQAQVRLPMVLVHVALVEQPPLLVAHSFTSVVQVAPVQPEGQEQVNVLMPSVQVPPF